MTMTKTLGQLPNAPLAYVLAQVRFSQILDMEKRVPDIQSVLRASFPRFNVIQGISLVITHQGTQQTPSAAAQWAFANDSNKKGVIVQTNSLVYHVTEYTTYPQFGSELLNVMKLFGEIVPDMFVERLGLRYIDYIVPKSGENPGLYVKEPLRREPDLGLKFKLQRSATAVDYESPPGILQIRFYVGANLGTLPPDLEPLPLEKSAVMTRKAAEGVAVGVLDWDRYVQLAERYNAEILRDKFNELHDDISSVFKMVVSDHAISVWSEK